MSLGKATVSKGTQVILDPGQAIIDAGSYTVTMAGEVSALMMGGIEKTFDTLGVNAGFQAVMKGLGDLDTSDAGLEKLFKDIDKE